MTNSAGPPAVAQPRPEVLPVPCAPCLRVLLMGQLDEPHDCELSTAVSIDGNRLVVGAPEDWCPCHCQNVAAEESEALRAARADARRVSAPARPLAEPLQEG
ncbi:hypothetical protein OG453_06935 [Streptomyces sp. NBC_01381]|uniref:hypothetical protein n=1 Tax=Streptomyces sp. NBC_01381 TaxID=2903845 RepID=UPI00224E8AA1|nr:hypothetical protein [Streptomyces sp. NBC_01381]MCX4666402.1 hypothetical protein [Streptomyces sp. NBC_01381]